MLDLGASRPGIQRTFPGYQAGQRCGQPSLSAARATSLALRRKRPDLDGALGFGAVDAEVADGGVDALSYAAATAVRPAAFHWRNLRQ